MAGQINFTQVGAFVETNFIWDVQQIQQLDEITPEFKELLVRLYQNLGKMATVLNTKDTGIYQLTEFVNGQRFFSNPSYNSSSNVQPIPRPDYRMVVNFGALPNSSIKSVPHNIAVNSGTTFTRVYGASTNPGVAGVILPSFDPSDITKPINCWPDNTNINVQTTSNMSAFTTTVIVIEYLKT